MYTPPPLSEKGYVRLASIIGSRKKGQPGLLPFGPTTWWDGVKSGRFPKPVKLGPRITAWRVEDIRALLERFTEDCLAERTSAPQAKFVPNTSTSPPPDLAAFSASAIKESADHDH
jgi:prophage regulatory protein